MTHVNDRIFKIFLRVQPTSLELARYLDKNIDGINRTGIKIQLEKLADCDFDAGLIDMLQKKGITRMPAMISSNGKVSVGLKQIIDVFDGNSSTLKKTEQVGGPNLE